MTTDTITLPRSVVEQALEALENYRQFFDIMQDGPDDSDVAHASYYLSKASSGATERVAALRAAIEAAKQEREVEPVGYVYSDLSGEGATKCAAIDYDVPNGTPLYTTPQPQVPTPYCDVCGIRLGMSVALCQCQLPEANKAAVAGTPPQQPQVPEWQPIETAPKDGTHILVRSYDNRCPPTVCHWFNEGWHLSVNRNGNDSEYSATEWKEI